MQRVYQFHHFGENAKDTLGQWWPPEELDPAELAPDDSWFGAL
jgi:hypothetical protein